MPGHPRRRPHHETLARCARGHGREVANAEVRGPAVHDMVPDGARAHRCSCGRSRRCWVAQPRVRLALRCPVCWLRTHMQQPVD
eukprot:15462340-Alexandrium_andersonii.AAC.1